MFAGLVMANLLGTLSSPSIEIPSRMYSSLSFLNVFYIAFAADVR